MPSCQGFGEMKDVMMIEESVVKEKGKTLSVQLFRRCSGLTIVRKNGQSECLSMLDGIFPAQEMTMGAGRDVRPQVSNVNIDKSSRLRTIGYADLIA